MPRPACTRTGSAALVGERDDLLDHGSRELEALGAWVQLEPTAPASRQRRASRHGTAWRVEPRRARAGARPRPPPPREHAVVGRRVAVGLGVVGNTSAWAWPARSSAATTLLGRAAKAVGVVRARVRVRVEPLGPLREVRPARSAIEGAGSGRRTVRRARSQPETLAALATLASREGESASWQTPTGSPGSTRRSCTSSATPPTCTSARCWCSTGRRPTYDELVDADRARGCTSCRATASGSRSSRSARAGRCGSTTRTSTSATTSATPRCPRPAARPSCKRLAGPLFSQQLDRSKPLWEIWLVERPGGRPLRADRQDPPRARGRHLGRRHHDRAVRHRARPRADRRPPDAVDRRGRCPSGAQLLADALLERADRPRRDRPRRARASLRGPAPGGSARAAAASAASARSPLRGPGRRAAEPAQRRASARTAASPGSTPTSRGSRRSRTRSAAPSTTSCSTAVAGALGPLPARAAASDTDGLELKAMVPVSVRADAERGALGNQVAAMWAPLPVGVEDPVERFAESSTRRWRGLKESGQAVGAQVLTELAGLRAADDHEPGGAPAGAPALLQPRRDERARPAVPALHARAAGCAALYPHGAAGPRTRRWASRS